MLVSHVGRLKMIQENSPIIRWHIIKKTSAYKGGEIGCRLCLEEKLCILESLNASKLLELSSCQGVNT